MSLKNEMIIPDRMKIKNNSSKNINPKVKNCGVSVFSSLFKDIVVNNMNVRYTAMNIAYEIMTAITGIFQRPERLSSACFLNVDDEYKVKIQVFPRHIILKKILS